jgi:predicted amidophosphoribosyltransferase
MNVSKCPQCGVKLGNYLYADACPHCHEELKHNTKPLTVAKKKDSLKESLWPVRIFCNMMRLVES